MKRVLVFCQSYDQVENALYVAASNQHGATVTVVLQGRPNFLKLWNALNTKVFQNRLNIVYFEFFDQKRTAGVNKRSCRIGKKLCFLLDIPRERQYLGAIFHEHFAGFEEAEVWFFNRRYSTYSLYLLEKLSKRNRLTHMHSRSDSGPIYKAIPTNMVELMSLIRCKLVFGWDITVVRVAPRRSIPYMSDRFLKKRVHRTFDLGKSNEMMKDFDFTQFRVFDVGNYSVMYFGQYLIQAGHISDGDTYKRELTQISSILARYFRNDEIAVKHAPWGNSDPVITIGEILPDFVPAEFLYRDSIRMYLTVCSTAISNVDKGLAVSLLDLISFKNDGTKEQMRELLMQQSHSETLFPKSLDEFEGIVASVAAERRAESTTV